MGIKEALERLVIGVQQVPHVYRPSAETFAELDVPKIAAEMELEKRGQANGEKQAAVEPGLDETEQEIIDYVKREQRSAHAVLHDQVQLYGERLGALDFEGALGTVESSAIEAAGEFRVQARQGRDLLHARRRDLQAMEEWRETFQKENRLRRPAIYPAPHMWWLKGGLLILLMAVEMIVNGNFLARGSEFGLVGGALEALSFAALNIVGTALIAFFGVRQLGHKNVFRKLVGLVSLAVYVLFALCLNLALAHYREIAGAGTSLDVASQMVVTRLMQEPFTLAELKSWILFGLGIGFSLAAFIDVISMDDIYPGYGKVERRLRSVRDEYVATKTFIINSLAEVRDAATQAMNDARRNLGVRRNEFDAIADHRQRLIRLFKNHEEHLDGALSRLVTAYRTAYRSALKSEPPERLDVRVTLKRTSIEEEVRQLEKPDRLYRAIESAQAKLSENLQIIHTEYESAAKELQQLDELFPQGASSATCDPKAA